MRNIRHTSLIWQAEIADTQRELKDLQFRETVLKKEKQLLNTFSAHVSKIHSIKVTRFHLDFQVDMIQRYKGL